MAENRVSQPLNADLQWTPWHTFALLIILAIMALTGLLFPTRARLWTWVVALVLLGVFAAVAGQGITGLWRGLLIDERNKISLARLQLTLWTIVVLSGFLTAALSNLAAAQPNPLAISVPSELWLLMGISTTSLVASPLIKSTKRSLEANEEEKGRTFALLAKQMAVEKIDDTVANRGQLVINRHPEDAQWADMFRGEETVTRRTSTWARFRCSTSRLFWCWPTRWHWARPSRAATQASASFPRWTPVWWRCSASAMRAT